MGEVRSSSGRRLRPLCATNAAMCAMFPGAMTVLCDDELTPRQQRNLEKMLGNTVRVGDRTALILDVFSQRAATREGKLQVRGRCAWLREQHGLLHVSTPLPHPLPSLPPFSFTTAPRHPLPPPSPLFLPLPSTPLFSSPPPPPPPSFPSPSRYPSSSLPGERG